MPATPQYITDRQQQQLLLDGVVYPSSGLDKLLHLATTSEDPWLTGLYDFLVEWFAPDPWLTVQTSGSTGQPKPLQVKKEHMVQSARLTCSFFGLQPGNTALLCMPLQYIAGKMMVVRALVGQLDLRLAPPSGHPFKTWKHPVDFVAMIPLQVYNTLQVHSEKELLAACKTLIIGGGHVDTAIEKALQGLPVAAYATYGMTETLSHIAVRPVNGKQASSWYIPFEKVSLSLSEEDTLQIEAPLISEDIILTNDIAELQPDGRFRITGRKDNIINSGGVKIQTELVEALLKPYITGDFAITFVNDPKFGQCIVLLVTPAENITFLKEKLCDILPKYQQPKYIFSIPQIPHTSSGKINRAHCHQLAESIFEKE